MSMTNTTRRPWSEPAGSRLVANGAGNAGTTAGRNAADDGPSVWTSSRFVMTRFLPPTLSVTDSFVRSRIGVRASSLEIARKFHGEGSGARRLHRSADLLGKRASDRQRGHSSQHRSQIALTSGHSGYPHTLTTGNAARSRTSEFRNVAAPRAALRPRSDELGCLLGQTGLDGGVDRHAVFVVEVPDLLRDLHAAEFRAAHRTEMREEAAPSAGSV